MLRHRIGVAAMAGQGVIHCVCTYTVSTRACRTIDRMQQAHSFGRPTEMESEILDAGFVSCLPPFLSRSLALELRSFVCSCCARTRFVSR